MNAPIKPMLAVPMTKGNVTNWKEWVAEEKYDGIRLIIEIAVRPSYVTAWTRPRKHSHAPGEKTMVVFTDLAPHVVEELKRFPAGVYDGEVISGLKDGTSSDVRRGDLRKQQRLVLFDVVFLRGEGITCYSYADRRTMLVAAAWSSERDTSMLPLQHVSVAEAKGLRGEQDVKKFVQEVWDAGGEGAILKRRASVYHPGKRSVDWIKVKKKTSAVLTVVGFERGRGDKVDRGPFAVVCLRDAQGRETTCKTVNDDQLATFEQQERERSKLAPHPAIGRQLRIDFQDYTRTGGYRGPVIWDRWEDE